MGTVETLSPLCTAKCDDISGTDCSSDSLAAGPKLLMLLSAIQLFGKPPSVGLDIDHRNGSAELNMRNQVEKKRRCRLATIFEDISVFALIKPKMPMSSDAPHVQFAIAAVGSQRISQRIAEGRTPVALEREDAAEDRD